jgi:hypothetical protein
MLLVFSAFLIAVTAATRRRIVAVAVLCGLSLLVAPPEAQGGTDLLAEIAAVLSTIGNTLTAALGAIHSVQSAEQAFQQRVLYPVTLINSAKGQITSMKATYRNFLNSLMSFNPHLATLPATQALEVLIRDRQTSNLASLQTVFARAFRPMPPATQMSPPDRAMTDMDDAFAQDTLAATKASDQAQDLLLQVADTIEDQAEISAPGSAPFLTAQAVVAQIKSQAVQQRMYAAMLREEAGQLAHNNALVKRSANQTATASSALERALNHH